MGREPRGESSRAATERLLRELRGADWTPRAWCRFFTAAGARSAEQARCRPRALVEVGVVHVLFLVAAAPDRRRWVVGSWVLSALHLGLLEARTSLGLANVVTLTRGNLPATAAIPEPWIRTIALATDFVDGRLARSTGTTTTFGQHADAFADAVFWTWTTRADNAATRVAVNSCWLGPIIGVTAASLARGAMVEPPRPRLFRPAAALQVILTARSLRRRWRGRSDRAMNHR